MPRQIALFLTAVQFLTRVPTPTLTDFRTDWIARSARYFPLVGALVGVCGAGVLWLASQVWSGAAPAVLAVGATILLTGAFHEDGLADTADGLGGAQTPARRLEIMKDSRIGTFGALALLLVIGFRIAVLADVGVLFAGLALVAAHGGARAAAVAVMRIWPYAGDRDHAKLKPVAEGVGGTEVTIALALGLLAMIPAFRAAPVAALAGLCAAVACATLMALSARRLIGGWVGDTLGATEQVFETAFLGAFLAVAIA